MKKIKIFNRFYITFFLFITLIVSTALYFSFNGLLSFTHGPLYYYFAEGLYENKELNSTIFALPTNDFTSPQMGIVFVHYLGILLFGKEKFFLFFIFLSSTLWWGVLYNFCQNDKFKNFKQIEKVIIFLLVFLQPYNINQIANFSNEGVYIPCLILCFFFILEVMQNDFKKNTLKIVFIITFLLFGSFFRVHNLVFFISIIIFLLALKNYKLFKLSIYLFILAIFIKFILLYHFFPFVVDNIISFIKNLFTVFFQIDLSEYSKKSNWIVISKDNILDKFISATEIFTFFLLLKKFIPEYKIIIFFINFFFIFIFYKSSESIKVVIDKKFNLLSIIFICLSTIFTFILPIFEYSYLLPTSFIIIIYYFSFFKKILNIYLIKSICFASLLYFIIIFNAFFIFKSNKIETYYYRITFNELKTIVNKIDVKSTLFYIDFEKYLTMPEFYRWIFGDKICNYRMSSNRCSEIINKKNFKYIIIKTLDKDTLNLKHFNYIDNIENYKIIKFNSYLLLENIK